MRYLPHGSLVGFSDHIIREKEDERARLIWEEVAVRGLSG
jgi:hypothetical protein